MSLFSELLSYFGLQHNAIQSHEPNKSTEDAASSIETLLRKVKKIEIISNRITNSSLNGQYKSAFRGQGIEFDEVREYTEGDDVRAIDWNVTARSGKPYVKRFSEEKERSLLFLLDVSASNFFGSKISRLETSIEIASSLMFSAIKNNDNIGLITFANGVRSYFPPQKGKNYVLKLIKEMVSARPVCSSTDLNAALEFVNKTIKRRAIIIILSDFYLQELGKPLLYCSKRHDVVALSVTEPFEKSFPNIGFVKLRDPETNEELVLDSGSSKVRKAVSALLSNRRAALTSKFKEAGVTPLFIENGSNYAPILRQFFNSRVKS